MASKTVPISARISHEDAEFLSQLEINGATTPSDKLRALLSAARKESEQQYDYLGYLKVMQELVSPSHDRIKNAENHLQIHSEIISRFIEWLPDICAYFIAAANPEDKNITPELLKHIEEGISNRIFRLMESILQMGVTKRCPCYENTIIGESIEPILDLAQAINLSHKMEGNER